MLRRAGPLALALLLLAACGGGSGRDASALVIGAVYPLSGPQAEGGKQELSGLQAALRVAEDQGLLSRPVSLKVEDVHTPTGARAAVDRLIDQDHVAIVAGTYGSTLAESAAAEADRRHTVYWESGAVADQVTQHREYVFRTVATGMTLGDTAVRFTHDVLLPRAGLQPAHARAVIVSVDDVYGRSVGDGEEALARQLGVQVVDRIRYDSGHYDPAAIAARVAANHPHYLWDVSYLDDGIAIWQAISAAGIQLRAAVGTSSAFCMPAFGERLGQQAIGVYAADKPDDQVNPGALTPAARSMLATARNAYQGLGMGSEMPIPAVAGFVAGWTLFHGVLPRIRGEVTPDSIRNAAYQVDEAAGSSINGGGVSFAAAGSANAGQNLRAPSVIGQWQAVGMVRAVWPARYAISQPAGSW
jgi:ABC-type branched-subunit amino acid transport system substrate-binding protein